MESAIGKISALDGDTATIVVASPVTCSRCAAGKGCGAGIIPDSSQDRQIRVWIPADMNVTVGDQVELMIESRYLLRAAILAYGLPLVSMLAALLLVRVFAGNVGDGVGIVVATLGLAAGAAAGRLLLRRESVCQQFVPTIVHRTGSV